MANQVSFYPIKIRESHLDTFGHVNNAVYLQLFEEARWELLNSHGFGLDVIRASGMGPVILEAHLKFRRELKLHDQIRIRSQLLSYEGKIAKFEQVMLNNADEECCTALFVFSLFDTKNRKLIDPTPLWLQALGQQVK